MKRPTLMNRPITAALAAAAALSLTGAAQAGPAEPEVPTAIAVAEGHKVFLVAHAVGVQIYSCNATGSAFSWTPVAPRADLFDDHGKQIGTHFAGPSWRTKDGSTVTGTRVGDGAVVDPTAVRWLLLAAKPASGSDDGRLAETSFIQRIATVGGLPPAAAQCNAATVGDLAEVPYRADYYFWKATS